MPSEKLPQILVDRHSAFMDNVLDIVHITIAATQELARYPQMLALHKAVENARRVIGEPNSSASTKHVEHLLPFVEKEKTRDFALLYGMATITLWSALEAFVDDYLVAALECFPSFASTQSVGRVKIAIGEYEEMTDHDRRRYILESLKGDTASRLKPGIGRFESILDRFNLGGAVGDELRSCLLEFSNVRNVLVHRSGIADRRLIAQCAWMGLTVGNPIDVNRNMLDTYATGALCYGAIVHRRMLLKHGCNSEAMDAFLMKLEPSAVRTISSKAN